jgi:AraC-like DNA-binding protein
MPGAEAIPRVRAGDRRRRVLIGADGLGSAPDGVVLASPEPRSYRAEWTSVRLGEVLLRSITSTPFSVSRRADHVVSHPSSAVSLVIVHTGSMQGLQGSRHSRFEPGDVGLVVHDEPSVYVSSSETRLTLATVSRRALSARADSLVDAVGGGILSSAALRRCASALIPVLASGQPAGTAEQLARLDRAATWLVEAAILDVAPGVGGGAERDDGVRARARRLIEADPADRDLSPQSVAAALGISVRTLQRAFRAPGAGVAAEIRNARLDRLADALRDEHRTDPIAEIAASSGFGRASQAARAFKARFGTTMRDYRRR